MEPVMIKNKHDIPETTWLALRQKLWPDCPPQKHRDEIRDIIRNPSLSAFFLCTADGQTAAFAEASVRTDYVNGCTTSPVAYLEGIYCEESARRLGFAGQLIAQVKQWGTENGCRELASDTSPDNTASQLLHRALGFTETERVIFYCQPLLPEK
ncbi:TPA: GNAT family N-acetyltransferase [Morganella morganii]|nr:GNAT family N-acetyltransferase [Morganella morganii]HDU8497314.1 GNAT family N-acetyltransferase [Morganella morganii]